MPTPLQQTRKVVEVVAVAGGYNFSKTLPVPQGQTLGWAVNASGLYALIPALQGAKIGVWGKVLPADTLVENGDRIEVYSPVMPEAVKAHRAALQNKSKQRKVTPDAEHA